MTAPKDSGRGIEAAAVQVLLAHQRQGDDDREEAQGVEQERRRDARRGDDEAADGGPDDARAVEHRRVERDRVGEVLAADHLDAERLTDRHVDRVGDAQRERDEHEHPDLDGARHDQQEDDEREDHLATCVDDQEPALGQRVGDDAGEQAEQQDGDELGGDDDAQPDRVVGQRQDEPRLGHLLHPRADERDRLAGEEQPVVAMAEGAQPADRGRSRLIAGPRVRPRRSRARGAIAVGSGPPSSSARCASRWFRRSVGPSIIAARRSALWRRISIWRSARPRTRRGAAAFGRSRCAIAITPAPGGLVLEQLADLGEGNPASSRSPLMNRRRSRSSGS